METLTTLVAIGLALGAGLMAGVFFAFSNFVMKALARLPTPQGAGAMTSINLVVLNPVFLGFFMGTAGLSLGGIVLAVLRWPAPAGMWLGIGGVLYLLGTFGVTAIRNVPLNEQLALANPETAEGAELWQRYQRQWTRWNHVRTVAAIVATLAACAALCQ
ncbi:MAG: DUF1772 domain-containing protein [Phycisphaerales bacterium]|nr:DUF1772 domain-containing protein [Phycisphaerales bacterium]